MSRVTLHDCDNTTTPPLREMRVELLRGCPLLCAHCSAHAAPAHPLHLPLGRVLDLLDEFAELGGRRVTFTGGEPLTYSGLETVLRRCRERGLAAHLFSSGVVFADGGRQAMSQEMLERLQPYLDGIAYSVYAATPSIHDRITRIVGSHCLTIDAARRTAAAGLEVGFHFPPTQINYLELPAVVELASRMSARRVRILRFVPQGRGRRNGADLALDDAAHRWLRTTVLELRGQYRDVAIHVGSAYGLLNLGGGHSCRACGEQIVVAADGTIAPCSAFGGLHVEDEWANIMQYPLRTVWARSSYLAQVRRELATADGCEGCLGQKALASGRIDASVPDPIAGFEG